MLEFARSVAGSFLAPRLATRRLLDQGHGADVTILLFLLSFLITSIFLVAFGERPEAGSALGAHGGRLLSYGAQYVFLAFLIGKLGRLSGGTGTQPETFLALAWYLVVSSFLAPFFIRFLSSWNVAMEQMQADPPVDPNDIQINGLALAMFATMYSLWLLANVVAELHRFQNIWGVIGVIIGVPVAFAMVAMSVMGALAVAP